MISNEVKQPLSLWGKILAIGGIVFAFLGLIVVPWLDGTWRFSEGALYTRADLAGDVLGVIGGLLMVIGGVMWSQKKVTKTWTFNLGNNLHTVRVDHDWWTGKRKIYLDHELVCESSKFFDTGSKYHFEVAARRASLYIRYRVPLSYVYELYVDGDLIR